MRTRIASLLIGAMTAVLIVAAPVAAGDNKVRIELDVNLATGLEAFEASGAFCAAGTAVSTPAVVTGHLPGRLQFHLEKTLTCDDGSGTLVIALDATMTFTGTVGGWSIAGGTGAYEGVNGGGRVVGTGDGSIIHDVYTGSING